MLFEVLVLSSTNCLSQFSLRCCTPARPHACSCLSLPAALGVHGSCTNCSILSATEEQILRSTGEEMQTRCKVRMRYRDVTCDADTRCTDEGERQDKMRTGGGQN
eukprot:752109-Hanusia_phi.AAC.2